jgi:phage terminase large subunit GpA-like protein
MSLTAGDPLDSLPLADGAAVFADAWSRGWAIPAPLSVSEWADQKRVISRTSGAEPGPWRTSRFPYLGEIMDCLSAHSPVREIAFMKSTQVGGTEVLNNGAGYFIDHAPGPAMVLMPTVDTAERWSKQRLGPMLVEMPCLASKVKPARSRDSGNTTLMKEFPAGVLAIVGANSSSGLRSMPVRYLLADEIDEYDDDLNEQGSAMELAERRTSTFSRRKILKISTPTVKGASAIEVAFEAGDQRHYQVPCPHCAAYQALRIDQLVDSGEYLCEGCGKLIAEQHKTAMLARGRWVARFPDRERRSYHLNALYSPAGVGYSWNEVVELRAAARKNAELQVTFANTILGIPFESDVGRLETNELAERAEDWSRRTIPQGCLILTCGIDVQANRWAVRIEGWGRNEQSWVIDYVEIPGDPTREDDWDELDKLVFSPIVNRFGVSLRPSVVAIDSGNWTHEVYRWVRKHRSRAVIAIKGSSQANKPVIGRPSAQDVNVRGRMQKHGVQLWNVGVNTAKDTLFARLAGDAGRDAADRRCHFPADLPTEFYQQLGAERYDPLRKRWFKKPGARNESWDCGVYCYAAACHPLVRVYALRDADWARLEAQLEPASADLFERTAGHSRGTDPVPTAPAGPPRSMYDDLPPSLPIQPESTPQRYQRGVRSRGLQ